MTRPLSGSVLTVLLTAAGIWAQSPTPPAPLAPAGSAAPETLGDRRFEREVAVDGKSVPLKPVIAKGLDYLASVQVGAPRVAGGAWEDVADRGAFGRGSYGPHVGITALACLAFMADGNLPGRGRYGRNVEEGLRYILANARRDGLITADAGQHGPMYGHGFATLFLAEVHGMTGRRDVSDALTAAVKLIVASQGTDGGWRYQPRPSEGDTSVTICQITALRAARGAGIAVPPATIDRAVDFIRKSQNSDGGFRYTLASTGSAFPRSAAAVVTLLAAGDERVRRDDPVLRGGLEYLLRHTPGPGQDYGHFYYGHYYAAQAMFLSGDEPWRKWFPGIAAELVRRQSDDGSWPGEAGSDYGAAMALIILQLPNRYLPIFQK